ncbi:hypothetical protein ES707_18432 [subsurface metagenome]
MAIKEVTEEERRKLSKGICPDCGNTRFLEGPHGGGAVNVKCANKECESKFNLCWPFTPERID